jgi:catechol-2,3-dioxygenase
MIRLEHANLSVVDTEAMTTFILTAIPEFRIRGEGTDGQGRHWRHVGNDEFYIALQAVEQAAQRQPYGNVSGLNHLGWETNDLEALERRMNDAGFATNMTADDHPARKRQYFYDPEGNDWEFVNYSSALSTQRNDYSR